MKNKLKSKSKVLTISSIICFIIGFLGIAFGIIVCLVTIGDDVLQSTATELGINEQIPHEFIWIFRYIFGGIYIIQGLAFVIEGGLLRRASRNGRKTTFLIFLLLISIVGDLLTLINYAVHSNYDFNSFINVVSVCIEAFILSKVFEVRRLDRE